MTKQDAPTTTDGRAEFEAHRLEKTGRTPRTWGAGTFSGDEVPARLQGKYIEPCEQAAWEAWQAARASSAAAQWLPIESAPKDGTEILGHTDVGALVLYWDTLSDNPERWSDGMSRYHRMPTHWMPLPAPPAKPADTAPKETQ